MAPFYLSTWEEYHTGVLQLGFINGPTEGILAATAVLFFSGLYGAAFWMQPVAMSLPAIAPYVPAQSTLADILLFVMASLVVVVQLPQRCASYTLGRSGGVIHIGQAWRC